jgi:hypothetical protein
MGVVVSVVLLDLAIYLQHVMFHAVPARYCGNSSSFRTDAELPGPRSKMGLNVVLWLILAWAL